MENSVDQNRDFPGKFPNRRTKRVTQILRINVNVRLKFVIECITKMETHGYNWVSM